MRFEEGVPLLLLVAGFSPFNLSPDFSSQVLLTKFRHTLGLPPQTSEVQVSESSQPLCEKHSSREIHVLFLHSYPLSHPQSMQQSSLSEQISPPQIVSIGIETSVHTGS